MTRRLGRKRNGRAGAARRQAMTSGAVALAIWLGAPQAQAGQGAAAREQQQYCATVAAAAETLRLERRRGELTQLETEVAARLQALETRRNELRAIVDQLDAFERNAGDALVALYSRMKPEAPAAQFSELDDDVAAALMLALKGKVSSAILNEMPPGRGAALIKRISDLRKSSVARTP